MNNEYVIFAGNKPLKSSEISEPEIYKSVRKRTPMFSISDRILDFMTEESVSLEIHREFGKQIPINELCPSLFNKLPSIDIDFSGSWTQDTAKKVLIFWRTSGMSQEDFAKEYNFPVSKFRSKVTRKARRSLNV